MCMGVFEQVLPFKFRTPVVTRPAPRVETGRCPLSPVSRFLKGHSGLRGGAVRTVGSACSLGMAVVALASGCRVPTEFTCSGDADCIDGQRAGMCESVGFCSFPDDSCASQRRFGEHATPSLSYQCVDADEASSGSTGAPALTATEDASDSELAETSAGMTSDGLGSTEESGISASGCGDGVHNGDETDVDCGGACGATCAADEGCLGGGDCASLVCSPVSATCVAESCGDGVRNGDESDVDCGGGCEAACATGRECFDGLDCTSLVCDEGSSTCAAPKCGDGVQNADESDVDCGGACGANCPTGGVCAENSDCASSDCESGVCHGTVSFDETDDDNSAGVGQELFDVACPAVTVVVDGAAATGGTLDLDGGLLHWRHNVEQSPGLASLTLSGLASDSEVTLSFSSFNTSESLGGFNIAPDAYIQTGAGVTLEWSAAIAGATDPVVLSFEVEHMRISPDNTYLETVSVSNVDSCAL